MRHSVAVLVVVGLLVCGLAYADIPNIINYQGRLTDTFGALVPDGNYTLTFKIYTDSTGGSAKWTESRSVAVTKGLFAVMLGATTPIPDSIFSYVNTFLGIQVGADPEITPRQRLSSVGYAYRCAKADTAAFAQAGVGGGGWVDDGSVVRLQTSTDNVGIGAQFPSEKLTVAGGNFGVWPNFQEPAILTNGYNVKLGDPQGVGNQVFLEIDDPGNKFVFNNGSVGIGTTSPDDNLHVADHIRVGEDAAYPTIYGEIKHDGGGTGFVINANAGGGGWADLHFQTNGTTKMFIESGGNVGIGTTGPGEKLEVNGNLKVTGAYKGNIGPNGGAPFPRPAYESGWCSINPGQLLTLTHNIGGNVDNYVVDLEFKQPEVGIHNVGIGGYNYIVGPNIYQYGAFWNTLTTTSITVYRQPDDATVEQIRIRIWVYN